jgi:hypothetical protein
MSLISCLGPLEPFYLEENSSFSSVEGVGFIWGLCVGGLESKDLSNMREAGVHRMLLRHCMSLCEALLRAMSCYDV